MGRRLFGGSLCDTRAAQRRKGDLGTIRVGDARIAGTEAGRGPLRPAGRNTDGCEHLSACAEMDVGSQRRGVTLTGANANGQ